MQFLSHLCGVRWSCNAAVALARRSAWTVTYIAMYAIRQPCTSMENNTKIVSNRCQQENVHRRKLWLNTLGWTSMYVVQLPWCNKCTIPTLNIVNIAVTIYYLLTRTISLRLTVDLACTAVRLFIMLARQSGTRCQMNLEIQTALIVLNG